MFIMFLEIIFMKNFKEHEWIRPLSCSTTIQFAYNIVAFYFYKDLILEIFYSPPPSTFYFHHDMICT